MGIIKILVLTSIVPHICMNHLTPFSNTELYYLYYSLKVCCYVNLCAAKTHNVILKQKYTANWN